jgi:predicted Ser/Thr protein kinase
MRCSEPGHRITVAIDNFMAMEFVDGVTLGEKIHGERTEMKKLLNVINGDTNERE